MICSAPRTLTPAEYAAALEELGMTAQEVSQPTRLELKIEMENERMSLDEHKAMCERYGYQI